MSTLERIPAASAEPDPAERPEALRRPALSRLVVFAMRGASMGFNFATQVVLARVMELSAFGITNTTLALLNILAIPAAFGYETAAIRYVALARTDRPMMRALSVRFVVSIARTSLLTTLFILAAAALAYERGAGRTATAVLFLAAIVPAFAFVRVGEGWLRGAGSLVKALLGSAVVIPLGTIILIGAEWLTHGRGHSIGVGGALGARALATAVALAATVAFVSSRLGWRLSPRSAIAAHERRAIRRTAAILCGATFLVAVATQADIVAVSYIRGAAEAGVYSAAARISQSLNIALLVVNFVLSPQIARLSAAGRTAALQQEVSAAANWSFGLMAIAVAVLAAGAPLVVGLFGSGFAAAAEPLRILLAGQLVNALCGPAMATLTMSGSEVPAIRVLASCVVVQMALFALLIPALGMTGAAISSALALAAINLGMVAYIRARLGIWSLPTPIARALP